MLVEILFILLECLLHELCQLLSIHSLKNLVLERPCLLPQTSRNVHLAETVPVHSNSLRLQILQQRVANFLASFEFRKLHSLRSQIIELLEYLLHFG